MARYRIMNRITKQWWDGEADSAQQACEKAGWLIGDCWVRQELSPGGWGKPRERRQNEATTR